jgi:hypothetical protein
MRLVTVVKRSASRGRGGSTPQLMRKAVGRCDEHYAQTRRRLDTNRHPAAVIVARSRDPDRGNAAPCLELAVSVVSLLIMVSSCDNPRDAIVQDYHPRCGWISRPGMMIRGPARRG